MRTTEAEAPTGRLDRTFLAAQALAVVAALALTLPTEIARWRAACETKLGWPAWLFEFHLDTTPAFLLLLVAPICGLVRVRRPQPEIATRSTDFRIAWLLAGCCGLTSIAISAWTASFEVGGAAAVKFGDLPPAYHDEYSYLLQAETFLAGRFSLPSHPQAPELFDQMHVLNEGRFASRYFPGTGLWLAPFLVSGHIFWAQWLAGGIAAAGFFWVGRLLGGNAVGLVAGMLTALSPGMALFSNLLLAHHSTIAGLALFLAAFLRWMDTRNWRWALAAGGGLSWAMVCRPMTAAGFALPFGAWFLIDWTRRPWERAFRSSAAALVAPLALGFLLLLVQNHAITGNVFVTPYGLYTSTYTPRHVYGFNNVKRGEKVAGPKVIENYDRWAENLTPRLAAQNVARRAWASSAWTLGVVPLAMSVVGFLVLFRRFDLKAWLIAASILSLHAVHVPYWFVGIMNWHYVFETGPLLLLLYAIVSIHFVAEWRAQGRTLMAGWWIALGLSAVVTNLTAFDPFWSYSRLRIGVDEVAFARLKYEGLRRLLEPLGERGPALVLIDADPADRSIDYVVNDPELSARVLRGRYRADTDLQRVRAAFPDRAVYVFRAKDGLLRRIGP